MYLIRIDDGKNKLRQEIVEDLNGLYKTPKERGLLNCIKGCIEITPKDMYCRIVLSHNSTRKSGYDISARYSFDILSQWFRFEYGYSDNRTEVMKNLSSGGWTCESITDIWLDSLDVGTTCINCGMPKQFYNGVNPLGLPKCKCRGFDFRKLQQRCEVSLRKNQNNNVLVRIARTLFVL